MTQQEIVATLAHQVEILKRESDGAPVNALPDLTEALIHCLKELEAHEYWLKRGAR